MSYEIPDHSYLWLFSCDQAAIWLVQSVRPSVRLSVCLSVCPSVTPFSPCSHDCIIMKFSGVITMVRSDVHAKGQVQRSKVKVTEVNTQLSRFRTLTPVWIHIRQWNHAHLGLCLGYVPALACGSCRVSDQGTTLRASDLHNARATILNPFNKTKISLS